MPLRYSAARYRCDVNYNPIGVDCEERDRKLEKDLVELAVSMEAVGAKSIIKGCIRSLEDTDPTCCHCILVSSGPVETRKELMRLLHSSGVVVRLEDCTKKAVRMSLKTTNK